MRWAYKGSTGEVLAQFVTASGYDGPMAWTQDQMLAAAGVGVGFIGILATVAVAVWQRRRKVLGSETWEPSALVTINPNMKSRFKVTFDDKPVVEPHWSAVRICNAGHIEIRREDFESPVVITAGTTIISAHTYRMKPSGLAPKVSVDDKQIRLEPLLLNVADEFYIGVVTDGAPGKLTCGGRIIGGEVRELASGPPRPILWLGYALFAAFALLLAFIVVVLMVSLKDATLAGAWTLGKAVLGIAAFFAAVIAGRAVVERRVWPDRWR